MTHPFGRARSLRRCLVAAPSLGLCLGLAPPLCPAARAEPTTDGAYGRLDGDLTASLEAGVSEALPGESVLARLGAHYLHTVGFWGQYDDSLGAGGQPVARALSLGLELRPLFLPRFSGDLERGPAHLDLLLDSLSTELGVFARSLPAASCDGDGDRCWQWGMRVGTGAELPLLGRADGPFIGLRAALLWPAESSAVGPRPTLALTGALSLTLGYRLLFEAHIVDAADRAP